MPGSLLKMTAQQRVNQTAARQFVARVSSVFDPPAAGIVRSALLRHKRCSFCLSPGQVWQCRKWAGTKNVQCKLLQRRSICSGTLPGAEVVRSPQPAGVRRGALRDGVKIQWTFDEEKA